ncbi:transmembrane protein 35B isoform 1-T1 [Sylvia borin]
MAAAFTALRALLGLFFFLTGALKVSDWLSADLHRHMASEFVRFAKVFPLKDLGFVPEPDRYLVAVGWVEVTAGLLLAFGPQLLQEISNFILSVVMIGESQRPSWRLGTPSARDPHSLTLLLAQVPSTRCWRCRSRWPCVPLPPCPSASSCCSTSAGTRLPPGPSSSDEGREGQTDGSAGGKQGLYGLFREDIASCRVTC